MTDVAEKPPICWGQDQEADVALVPFPDREAADRYVGFQNRAQGRERWRIVGTPEEAHLRTDGTPAIMPDAGHATLGGATVLNAAQAYEVAGAVLHASQGVRRIAGALIATPVDGVVHLDVVGTETAWRFDAAAARRFAVRLAAVASVCISIPRRTS